MKTVKLRLVDLQKLYKDPNNFFSSIFLEEIPDASNYLVENFSQIIETYSNPATSTLKMIHHLRLRGVTNDHWLWFKTERWDYLKEYIKP